MPLVTIDAWDDQMFFWRPAAIAASRMIGAAMAARASRGAATTWDTYADDLAEAGRSVCDLKDVINGGHSDRRR